MKSQTLYNFIRDAVAQVPEVKAHLSQDAIWNLRILAIKAATNYEIVRREYWEAVSDAVVRYLTGNSPVTKFRNEMWNAMNSAFQTAAEIGYTDGGSEVPLSSEVQSWVDGQVDNEKANITSLFQELKKNWETIDATAEGFRRADGYARTLDSIYTQGKMYGAGNPMLTWHLGNTEEHCDKCRELNGKRHKASWFIERNYIPKKPAAAMDCNGYNCDCWFTDDAGNEYWI